VAIQIPIGRLMPTKWYSSGKHLLPRLDRSVIVLEPELASLSAEGVEPHWLTSLRVFRAGNFASWQYPLIDNDNDDEHESD
jgi:hypothetical protein